MIRLSGGPSASTLILSLLCVSGLALAAAYTLQRVSPRFQMASQVAAWQEARLTAESGFRLSLIRITRRPRSSSV